MSVTQGLGDDLTPMIASISLYIIGTTPIIFNWVNLQLIKESLMVTIPYISLIINTSIVTKVFPKPWKHSIIIPIHKSDDIEEPTIFISINLFQFYKKARKCFLNSIINRVLRKNKLLNESEYAYRNNSSTEQALVNVIQSKSTNLLTKLKSHSSFSIYSKPLTV